MVHLANHLLSMKPCEYVDILDTHWLIWISEVSTVPIIASMIGIFVHMYYQNQRFNVGKYIDMGPLHHRLEAILKIDAVHKKPVTFTNLLELPSLNLIELAPEKWWLGNHFPFWVLAYFQLLC